MTERLKVYLNGTQVGFLAWDSKLDVFSFNYISDYLRRDKAIPISRSLPLKEGAFDALASRTFFENLLPPEVVRRKLEKILHHDWRNTFVFLYDREESDGSVRRILQEDFCQSMGVPAEEKYESDGGPSAVRCFRFLRDAGFGFAALARFVDALAFNFIVGNADAHAKNFSILYRDGKASLAPLYKEIFAQSQRRLNQLF